MTVLPFTPGHVTGAVQPRKSMIWSNCTERVNADIGRHLQLKM